MRTSPKMKEARAARIVALAGQGKTKEEVCAELALSLSTVKKSWPGEPSNAAAVPAVPPVSAETAKFFSPKPKTAVPSETASPLARALEAAGESRSGPAPVAPGAIPSGPTLPLGITAEAVADEIVESSEFVVSVVLTLYARRIGIPPSVDVSEDTRLTKEEKSRLRSSALRGAPYLYRLTGGPMVGAIMFAGFLGKAMLERGAALREKAPKKAPPARPASPPPPAYVRTPETPLAPVRPAAPPATAPVAPVPVPGEPPIAGAPRPAVNVRPDGVEKPASEAFLASLKSALPGMEPNPGA